METPTFIKKAHVKPKNNHRPREKYGEEMRTPPGEDGIYFVNYYPVMESTGPRRPREMPDMRTFETYIKQGRRMMPSEVQS